MTPLTFKALQTYENELDYGPKNGNGHQASCSQPSETRVTIVVATQRATVRRCRSRCHDATQIAIVSKEPAPATKSGHDDQGHETMTVSRW